MKTFSDFPYNFSIFQKKRRATIWPHPCTVVKDFDFDCSTAAKIVIFIRLNLFYCSNTCKFAIFFLTVPFVRPLKIKKAWTLVFFVALCHLITIL